MVLTLFLVLMGSSFHSATSTLKISLKSFKIICTDAVFVSSERRFGLFEDGTDMGLGMNPECHVMRGMMMIAAQALINCLAQ